MAKIKRISKQTTLKKNPDSKKEAENEQIINEELTAIPENDETPLIRDENEDELLSDENLQDLTLAELAEIAIKYSNRSIETLKRLKRDELYYIILNKKDDFKTREFATLTQDTKDVIELFIELLNDCKKKREGKELNALLVKILRKQDKKINESLVKIGASGGIISYSLLIFVIFACFIDAFIGFDNLIEKIKKRTSNVEQSKV